MKIDEDKQARQELGGERWKLASINGGFKNGIGTLVYPTGFGKTYSTFLLCEKIINKGIKHNNDYTFHITVPGINLSEQWEEDLIKYFGENVYKKHFCVRVINTVMSALVRTSAYVSILDEIHEYVNDDRIRLLEGKIVVSEFLLGLTATYFDKKRVRNVLDRLCPKVDFISEEEAIDNGWLPKFTEYNLGIDLDIEEKKRYTHYSETITLLLEKFGEQGFKLATKCLTGGLDERGNDQRNMYWCTKWAEANGWKPKLDLSIKANADIEDEWNPWNIIQYAKSLMAFVRKRKDLLYNSKTKLEATIEVIKKFQSCRIITFSQSTAFAEDLSNKLNKEVKEGMAVCFHSGLEPQMLPSLKTGKIIKFGVKRLKDRAMTLFKTNVANVMCTANALDRGFNDKSINIGLNTSGTTNPIQQKQRGGRVKRIENYDTENKVLIINLYCKHTKDHDWLKARQFTSYNEIIDIYNINDIKYEINDKN